MPVTPRSPTALLAAILLAAAAPALSQAGEDYVLGPNDQIEITIYGLADKGARTRIRSDGSVTLPLVGPVRAAGRNAGTLATDIEGRLKAGGFVRDPIVNVEVVQYVSRAVTVLGQVATPGVYPLDHAQTVGTMIARAGGIRDGGSEFVVLRRGAANAVQRLSLAALAQDGARDVALQAGDTLYIGEADRFYIYGQVNSPGTYPIQRSMTLRQALARGGGPTLAGTERRITLYRDRQTPGEADLDGDVRPGDVLFVRERSF